MNDNNLYQYVRDQVDQRVPEATVRRYEDQHLHSKADDSTTLIQARTRVDGTKYGIEIVDDGSTPRHVLEDQIDRQVEQFEEAVVDARLSDDE